MKIWRINNGKAFHKPHTLSSEDTERLRSLGIRGQLQENWGKMELHLIPPSHPDDIVTIAGDIYFPFGLRWVPLLTEKALQVLEDLTTQQIQLFPCRLMGDEIDLYAVSVINHIDNCIRWDQAAEIEHWRNSTKLKRIHPLVLSAESVRSPHIFMLTEWLTSGVYVSDEFKDAVERNQLTGLTFQPIEVV
jgi:hypothetical protein